jgi:hypothetical protein
MIKKLALVAALTLFGCDSTTPPTAGPITEPAAGQGAGDINNDAVTTIHGRAEFVNGVSATDSIEIELRGTEYSTELNSNGTFEFVIPQSESDETLYFEFHGPNIMHDSIKLPVKANSYDAVARATLSGRNPAITFDASAGGTFENLNSYNRTKVTVSAQAFELSDGTVATGEVQVQITEADINNLSASGSWANNLYGTSVGSSEVAPLVTYGMAEFYFSQDGNELQLRDGFTATLQMDLLSPDMMGEDGFYKDAAVGDSIPLWYYDHDEVIWKNEGMLAYLQEDQGSATGFVQVGEVTHFSHYNTDRPCPPDPPPPPAPECPDDDLTCYWDFTYSVDLVVTISMTDDGGALGDVFSADSWTTTINGAPHSMTATDNRRFVASGRYTMDWLGNISGDDPRSGSVILTIDDIRTNRHPGRVIDFAQLAAYNNLTSEGDLSFSVPWTWVDGVISVNLALNLPPH